MGSMHEIGIVQARNAMGDGSVMIGVIVTNPCSQEQVPSTIWESIDESFCRADISATSFIGA